MTDFRIGYGNDIHRLAENRKLILGGVHIPHSMGLQGHSDADVLIHAVIDAWLGALALGDIGSHFPDNDDRWKDADSRQLLAAVLALPASQGWQLNNLDITVNAQRPKLAPFIGEIREILAQDLHAPISRISVKAKTGEHIGFVGREEGIMVQAVLTLKRI